MEELAAQTGMNENTIKVKLFRARQKLVKAAQRLDRAPAWWLAEVFGRFNVLGVAGSRKRAGPMGR